MTNEEVTAEELGGASVHTTRSSIADRAFDNDVECLLQIRQAHGFPPGKQHEPVPELPTKTALTGPMSLDTLIPDNPNKPYDMKELILRRSWTRAIFEI